MKPNLISLKEALTLMAQTIRQPGWDLEAIETRLDILMKESEEFEKELQKLLQIHRQHLKVYHGGDTRHTGFVVGQIALIKKILGEGDS